MLPQKILFALSLTLLFLAGACGSSPSAPLNVFGDTPLPTGSTLVASAEPNQELNIAIGLLRSQGDLKIQADNILRPSSSQYQQYRSVQGLAAEFGASGETQSFVNSFLQRYGITLQLDPSGSFLYGKASVAELSRLFLVELNQYSLNGLSFIAPGNTPKLPSELNGRVTEVFGLSTAPGIWFGNPGASGSPSTRPPNVISGGGSPTFSGTASGCSEALAQGGFSLSQLEDAYGVTPLKSRGYAGQGIHFGFLEASGFSQSDIDAYLDCFGIQNATTPQVITVGDSPLPPDPEAYLDLEVALTIAPQLEGVYVFQQNIESFADFLTLMSAALDTDNTNGNPVDILSVSLGLCEEFWTPSLVNSMEHLMMTAAASGMNIFVAAGDSGPSGCFHNDGVTTTRSASYPATSQYVTAVGGSNLALNPDNSISGEGVWNDIDFPAPYNQVLGSGGGGTSAYLAQPFWQVGTGLGGDARTVPDVAFFSDVYPGYPIRYQGQWLNVGGTSASTPFFAASVALLTQIARSQNMALDPSFLWIYSMANSPFYDQLFGDIVAGNNDLFGVGCCSAGVGYDLASGWGSVNIEQAANLLLAP